MTVGFQLRQFVQGPLLRDLQASKQASVSKVHTGPFKRDRKRQAYSNTRDTVGQASAVPTTPREELTASEALDAGLQSLLRPQQRP